MLVVWLIVAVVAILAIYLIYVFNKLVRTRNRVNNAWSQIDVQLRRRYDLIPNLVETVKGYAAHERELFEEVTRARAQGQQASTVQDQATAENQLTSGLRRLIAVAENYPQLKASQNFLALQEELTSTESKIAFARQFYNDQVTILNNLVQSFPSNVVATMFAFRIREFFEIEEATARGPVATSFS
ncbi:MAG: LemA family protein [Actinomycetota bacterium]